MIRKKGKEQKVELKTNPEPKNSFLPAPTSVISSQRPGKTPIEKKEENFLLSFLFWQTEVCVRSKSDLARNVVCSERRRHPRPLFLPPLAATQIRFSPPPPPPLLAAAGVDGGTPHTTWDFPSFFVARWKIPPRASIVFEFEILTPAQEGKVCGCGGGNWRCVRGEQKQLLEYRMGGNAKMEFRSRDLRALQIGLQIEKLSQVCQMGLRWF